MIELISDVNSNIESLKKEDNQLNRRNFLRSFMSYCEGDLANFRSSLISLIQGNQYYRGYIELNEYYPILNHTPRLDSRGKIRKDPNRTPFLPLLKYSIQKYSEIIECDEIFIDSDDWKCFIETIRIRNRITHPNENNDSIISEKELDAIKTAYRWWLITFKRLREKRNTFLHENPDFKLIDFNK